MGGGLLSVHDFYFKLFFFYSLHCEFLLGSPYRKQQHHHQSISGSSPYHEGRGKQ